MGFLDRFTKKDLRDDGQAGTAVLRSAPSWDKRAEDVGEIEFSRRYRLDLEVRIPGRDPYVVSEEFKVPKKWFDITTGVELPVQVDAQDPDRILIDWKTFDAAGGKQIVKDRGAQAQRDANYKAVSQNPVLRQNAQNALEGWVRSVKAGVMSVQDFHGYVDEYVTSGMLTAEEGDAAKAEAAAAGPA